MKKYILILLFSLFFIFINYSKTSALSNGICIITQLDKKYDVETPFYWYKVTNETTVDGLMVQRKTYSHTENFIDTKEKCLNINKSVPKITHNKENILNSTVTNYYYSKVKVDNSETIYNDSFSIFELFSYDGNEAIINTEYISLDDKPPIIATDNLNSIILVPVEHTINANYLKNKLIAYDEVDGNIQIKIHENIYSSNSKKLGDYPITFSATDESGNTAYLTITIRVVDVTKPTISGQSNLISSMSNPLTLQQIKNSLTITDNYYTISNNELSVIENNFTNNEYLEGTFKIIFNVTDESNNKSENFTINITTYDDIPPTINGETTYEVSNKILLDINKIKDQLNVKDNIDENVNIELTADTYSGNFYKTGIFQISFIAKDKNNNISNTHTINITVKDITKPTFYISQKFIGVDGSSTITIDQLIEIIQESNNIPTSNLTKYSIIKDEYTPNMNIPGKYLIELNYEYENKENINVQTYIIVDNYNNKQKEQTKNSKKVSFWSLIKSFLIKLWKFIKNIFIYKK